MRKLIALATTVVLGSMLTGCALTGGTDLSDVARGAGLNNVTTGDGTFENYTATGYYEATEIGFAVGLPLIGKFFEVVPAYTNEDLLAEVATAAKQDGADSLINVDPTTETYWGFPFIIFGLYVDHAAGTGIATK